MFCPSKNAFIIYNIVMAPEYKSVILGMAHIPYTNTLLIFREVQYTKLKFITENAYAAQRLDWQPLNRPHLLQTVLMETNAFWTTIVEKVVNVKRLVGKHMGNYLSFSGYFGKVNLYFPGIKDNLYSISMEDR